MSIDGKSPKSHPMTRNPRGGSQHRRSSTLDLVQGEVSVEGARLGGKVLSL